MPPGYTISSFQWVFLIARFEVPNILVLFFLVPSPCPTLHDRPQHFCITWAHLLCQRPPSPLLFGSGVTVYPTPLSLGSSSRNPIATPTLTPSALSW